MKGVITMSLKEANRVTILEKLIRKEMKQKQAARLLGLSSRQVRRLLVRYQQEGNAGLIHKSRGCPGKRRIEVVLLDQALSLVKRRYADFGPTLAYEKLSLIHGFAFSRETLRKAMISTGIWRAKRQKKPTLYQMRERRPVEGELVLLDGSSHAWFEDRGSWCTLLVFIDDATGKLLHLQFAPSESTRAYFSASRQYFLIHGKPMAIYLDKHSVFRVNTAKGGISETTDSNGETQFARAMKELGITLIFANTPQAKGRVERANQTLQDRLVKELRLRHLKTMEEGNRFLPEFIEEFNRRFAVIPREKGNAHRPLLPSDNLDKILVEKHQRILSKQLTFQYQNKLYQIKTNRPTYAMRYAPVVIQEDNQGNIAVFYQSKKLEYKVLLQQPKAQIVDSKHLNLVINGLKERQTNTRRKVKPGPNHPWKRSFIYT